jgi:hypothetical protein
MRFGDVQDISRKETGREKGKKVMLCLEKQMRRISMVNRERRLATVYGVTFTV